MLSYMEAKDIRLVDSVGLVIKEEPLMASGEEDLIAKNQGKGLLTTFKDLMASGYGKEELLNMELFKSEYFIE